MSDCECYVCPVCDGEGIHDEDATFGGEEIPAFRCHYCNGEGVDPNYMGCDC